MRIRPILATLGLASLALPTLAASTHSSKDVSSHGSSSSGSSSKSGSKSHSKSDSKSHSKSDSHKNVSAKEDSSKANSKATSSKSSSSDSSSKASSSSSSSSSSQASDDDGKDEIEGGGAGDPGIYPGGVDGAYTGWRVLPDVTGAKLDNTTIKVGPGAAVTQYITDGYDPTKIIRAVIQIGGENRDAWNQWLYSNLALDRAVAGGTVTRESVVISSPMFFQEQDYGAYPATSQNEPDPDSEALVWRSTYWGDGTSSDWPLSSNVGAFDVLDAMTAFFLNQTAFPALTQVVVAGFSLGGQLVQRYATLGDNAGEDRIQFWISSPASFVYMNASRPITPSDDCVGVNNYKYGLSGATPSYVRTSSLAQKSSNTIAQVFSRRRIAYAVGTKDDIDGDVSCQAAAQGIGHFNKMRAWTEQVVPYLPGNNGSLPAWSTIDYVGNVSHQDWRVIASDPGVQRIFLDNYPAMGQNATAPPSNGDVAVDPNSVDANGVPITPGGKDAALTLRPSAALALLVAAASLLLI